MIATYKLNAEQIDTNLIESIKSAFYGKEISIVVSEEDIDSMSSEEMINRINISLNDAENERIISNDDLRLEINTWVWNYTGQSFRKKN